MKTQNSDIAQKFNDVADLLEIEGANPFRIRAYRNAAKTLLGTSENVSEILKKQNDLTSLPGIGKDLSSKIIEIIETGHLSLLDTIEKRIPSTLKELLDLPGLGPKRVFELYSKLEIKNINDLKKAISNQRINQLKGFGEKTTHRILNALQSKTDLKVTYTTKTRLLLNEADEIASPLVEYLKKSPLIKQIDIVGSYRRRQETIGDIDILVSSSMPKVQVKINQLKINKSLILKYFLNYPEISEIIIKGENRSTVLLQSGVQVDLLIVQDRSYGAALLYFTGSKAHNIALRKLALQNGYKLNEYGLFSGHKIIASQEESQIYKKLNLPFIEPELRENSDEIESGLKGKLPLLVLNEDIKGDLHVHTRYSDGFNTVLTMAQEAQKLGYEYLAITDHSKRLGIARGLKPEELLEQIKEINLINQQFTHFRILKSSEVDILEDGQLDFKNELLAQLDFTICAVHSHFSLSQEKQTKRIIRAMENPYFRILAHPTGRLIHDREAYQIDFEKIILAASKYGRILEINSQPQRMDLPEPLCRLANKSGVKFVISTDAHNANQLKFMSYGVSLARRAWLEKENIINTFSLKKLLEIMR